jgi:hypothetical protein
MRDRITAFPDSAPFGRARLKGGDDSRRSTMPHDTSATQSRTRIDSGLEKKLLGYAAMAAASGVAVLALSQSSEAKIIYTATHQKVPLNTPFELDVNGDGIADFSFFANTFLGGAARRETYTFNSDVDMEVFGVAKSNQVWGKIEFRPGALRPIGDVAVASALPAGVRLGPNGKFAASNAWMGGVSATDGEPPSYFGPWAPDGGNVKERYVGLKFVVDGETHYGWARFNVQMRQPLKGNLQAILTGYAYESVANAPILAGDTGSSQEALEQSGSLGKLASGAAGR